jgi:hypothetical protein
MKGTRATVQTVRTVRKPVAGPDSRMPNRPSTVQRIVRLPSLNSPDRPHTQRDRPTQNAASSQLPDASDGPDVSARYSYPGAQTSITKPRPKPAKTATPPSTPATSRRQPTRSANALRHHDDDDGLCSPHLRQPHGPRPSARPAADTHADPLQSPRLVRQAAVPKVPTPQKWAMSINKQPAPARAKEPSRITPAASALGRISRPRVTEFAHHHLTNKGARCSNHDLTLEALRHIHDTGARIGMWVRLTADRPAEWTIRAHAGAVRCRCADGGCQQPTGAAGAVGAASGLSEVTPLPKEAR